MTTKAEAALALQCLRYLKNAKIGKSDDALFLRPLDSGTKLHMTTQVYGGEKYIPYSVRERASHALDLIPTIQTWLSIEEDLFQISLNYHDHIDEMDAGGLYEITLLFEEIAIRWRQIFEEKDRQDLVHVHQSR